MAWLASEINKKVLETIGKAAPALVGIEPTNSVEHFPYGN